MKKISYFLLAFLMLAITTDVKAEVILEIEDCSWTGSYNEEEDSVIEKVYVASGKKISIKIRDLYKSDTIKVKTTSSSNVSCTIKNLDEEFYELKGDTFNYRDGASGTTDTDIIGEIICSLPTTDSIIKNSKDMWLTANVEATGYDWWDEQEVKENKTYKYQFGVLNEKYLSSLSEELSIVSVSIDGKDITNMDEYETIEVNKESVAIKIKQNEFASKNKLYLEKNVNNETSEEEIKSSEITLKMPYGRSEFYIIDYSEKEIFYNEHFNDNQYTLFGFSDEADFAGETGAVYFILNRVDNRSKVNTLKSLTISDATISFKPELKNYIVSVPYKVSKVEIKSILSDPKSSYVKGYGNRSVNLKEGLNTVLVKVKAENGKEATYTLKITREQNDDSSLKTITVNDKVINVVEDLLIYTTNVNNDVIKPTVKVETSDKKAKVTIDEIKELKEGSNEISITVTAVNGNKSVYVIDIIRDKLISTNSKLKKLEVKNHELNFNAEKTEYDLHINHDIDKLDLIVETEHEKAKYIITGNKDLNNDSIIKIKVTAEDEVTTTTYTINIEKEKKPFNILIIIIPTGILLLGAITLFIVKKNKKINTGDTQLNSEPTPVQENINVTPIVNSEPINNIGAEPVLNEQPIMMEEPEIIIPVNSEPTPSYDNININSQTNTQSIVNNDGDSQYGTRNN